MIIYTAGAEGRALQLHEIEMNTANANGIKRESA